MLPLVAAAGLSAIGGAIGQGMANDANRDINEQNNAFNAYEATKSRQWQENMSNSAYQRSMADMRAAGLNPMLAMGGGGASSGGGATASASNAPAMQDTLGKGLTSALDTLRFRKELDQTDSNVKLNEASEKTQQTQQALNVSNSTVAKKNAEMLEAKLPAVKAQAKLDKLDAEINEKAAPLDHTLKRTGDMLGQANSAKDLFMPSIRFQTQRVRDQINRQKTTKDDGSAAEYMKRMP